MREKLARIEGQRCSFTATYAGPRTRTSGGYVIEMLLFKDVQDAAGNAVCDHIHFTRAKCWNDLNLQPGERVAFDGRSRSYEKGYIDKHTDFRISHPTNIRRVETKPIEELPLFKALPHHGAQSIKYE